MINSVAVSSPTVQIVLFKYHLLLNEARLLRETSDSRSVAGNKQDEPGTSCYTRKQESHSRVLKSCEKNFGANLRGLPWSKDGTVMHFKMNNNCSGLKHTKCVKNYS